MSIGLRRLLAHILAIALMLAVILLVVSADRADADGSHPTTTLEDDCKKHPDKCQTTTQPTEPTTTEAETTTTQETPTTTPTTIQDDPTTTTAGESTTTTNEATTTSLDGGIGETTLTTTPNATCCIDPTPRTPSPEDTLPLTGLEDKEIIAGAGALAILTGLTTLTAIAIWKHGDEEAELIEE